MRTVMPTDSWYDTATVYALDVKRFADSDGDGVGDFQGLTDRLDYLADLGVSAVWLLPFYPSPGRDNGYDVADYRDVDSRLGTLEEFEAFVDAAHERDVRVITDLVVNHTSDQHPWFQAAREDPDSKYRDYYVWADAPERQEVDTPERQEADALSRAEPDGGAATEYDGTRTADPGGGRSMFPGEVENARIWSYDETADAYYYHRFYPFQPELNVANPVVREELADVVGFWLDRGVDGFRVDAATLLVQPKGGAEPAADPMARLRDLKHHAVDHGTDPVFLAEADDDPKNLCSYVDGGGMDSLLNFVLGASIFAALATGSSTPLDDAFADLPDLPTAGWGNFLRNHDELNLSKLSAERKQSVFEAFAPEEGMRIYGRGIRRRLAPMLGGDRDRVELAYSLLFSLPGTPMLYYGDEIGMGEDLSQPGRDAVRTPMQWSDERNAGFSSADTDDLVAQPVSGGEFGYERVNVAAQEDTSGSLLDWMRDLVATRADCPSLTDGRYRVVDADGPAFVHRHDHQGETVVCAHNLGTDPVDVVVPFDTADPPATALDVEVAFGDADVDSREDDLRVHLDGHGYVWLRAVDED